MTTRHYSNSQNLVISFEYSWFLAKNISNFVSLPWKLYNRKCHNVDVAWIHGKTTLIKKTQSTAVIPTTNNLQWSAAYVQFTGVLLYNSAVFWLYMDICSVHTESWEHDCKPFSTLTGMIFNNSCKACEKEDALTIYGVRNRPQDRKKHF